MCCEYPVALNDIPANALMEITMNHEQLGLVIYPLWVAASY